MLRGLFQVHAIPKQNKRLRNPSERIPAVHPLGLLLLRGEHDTAPVPRTCDLGGIQAAPSNHNNSNSTTKIFD